MKEIKKKRKREKEKKGEREKKIGILYTSIIVLLFLFQ